MNPKTFSLLLSLGSLILVISSPIVNCWIIEMGPKMMTMING